MIVTEYSTKKISPTLLQDIARAIKSVENFGSVELYVQEGIVTQITTRTIKRTNSKEKQKSS